ncbi:MAG: FxLYD domain-containing protein [Vulcanimicrobiaceae bacterium]
MIIVLAFLLVMIAIAMLRVASTTSSGDRDSQSWNTKATWSVQQAGARVGGFTSEGTRLYELGVQHIRNRHQSIGSFTIRQVLDQEQAREDQRAQVAEMQQTRRANEAAARAAAEEANFMYGTPDCLVMDKRTVHSSAGDYSWSIVGKITNRCDHDLSYVQVEIGFYDASGALEASGLTNVNNLAAGQTWAFTKRVYETDDPNGRWGITRISGY